MQLETYTFTLVQPYCTYVEMSNHVTRIMHKKTKSDCAIEIESTNLFYCK